MVGFLDDPLASGSGRFPLAASTTTTAPTDAPSQHGLRPWGLRRMGEVLRPGGWRTGWHYDHERQVGVSVSGVPLLTLRSWSGTSTTSPMAGPPTAPTTPPVDGEDPPSAEDYVNDYCPDQPVVP